LPPYGRGYGETRFLHMFTSVIHAVLPRPVRIKHVGAQRRCTPTCKPSLTLPIRMRRSQRSWLAAWPAPPAMCACVVAMRRSVTPPASSTSGVRRIRRWRAAHGRSATLSVSRVSTASVRRVMLGIGMAPATSVCDTFNIEGSIPVVILTAWCCKHLCCPPPDLPRRGRQPGSSPNGGRQNAANGESPANLALACCH